MKRLESIQQRLAKLQSQIEYADTEEEKIALTKQLSMFTMMKRMRLKI
mgnify:CR=1 FL=1